MTSEKDTDDSEWMKVMLEEVERKQEEEREIREQLSEDPGEG